MNSIYFKERQRIRWKLGNNMNFVARPTDQGTNYLKKDHWSGEYLPKNVAVYPKKEKIN